jgi:hypothetical protein
MSLHLHSHNADQVIVVLLSCSSWYSRMLDTVWRCSLLHWMIMNIPLAPSGKSSLLLENSLLRSSADDFRFEFSASILVPCLLKVAHSSNIVHSTCRIESFVLGSLSLRVRSRQPGCLDSSTQQHMSCNKTYNAIPSFSFVGALWRVVVSLAQ